MFDQLIASRPGRDRSTGKVMTSIIMHTVIIAVSIQLTRAAAATVVKTLPQAELLLPRAPARPASRPPEVPAPAPTIPAAPSALVTAPPITDPVGIAPPILSHGFDPATLSRPTDGHAVVERPSGSDLVDANRVAILDEVDEPVTYLDGPAPDYLPALRRAGIEGWVQLRFIVGVDGRAEPGSIDTVQSSNPLLGTPAIDAIRLARFTPARIRGHKVRQLVEQLVRFTLH